MRALVGDPGKPGWVDSDETLMGAFGRAGDRGAFEELVARYMDRAVAVARQLLGRGLSAEDAAQEAFLLLVRHRGRYRAGGRFAPWFFTILRNVCRGMQRGQSRQMRLLTEAAAQLQQQAPGKPPELPSLQELLGELDEQDRVVLLLRVVEGLGFEEIAAAMGISKEAAKKRGQRALRRIRQSKLARGLFGEELKKTQNGTSPRPDPRNRGGGEGT